MENGWERVTVRGLNWVRKRDGVGGDGGGGGVVRVGVMGLEIVLMRVGGFG
jgi:hypothetical protein